MMRAGGTPADPWVAGGLALLALLTLGTILLYRSAPQTVEEARSRAWVAARPDAFTPQLARARERLRTAAAASEAGNDSLALATLEEAAAAASEARRVAEAPERAEEAGGVWAQALLGQAVLLHRAGRGRGLRPDDNELLRRALGLVERVRASRVPAPLRQRADSLHAELQRDLRTGPLEWLPSRR